MCFGWKRYSDKQSGRPISSNTPLISAKVRDTVPNNRCTSQKMMEVSFKINNNKKKNDLNHLAWIYGQRQVSAKFVPHTLMNKNL